MRFWAWAMLGAAALGCSSGGSDDARGPDESTLSGAKQTYCAGYCASGRRCADFGNQCESNCQNEYHPTGARPSAVAAVGRCLQAQTSCEPWEAEEPTALCWDEARLEVAPNQVVIDYCESSSLHAFECGAWWGVDQCLETVNIWSDAVLQEAMVCHNLECEEMFSCEAGVWERY